MMKHQHFEEWLFNQDALSVSQAQELQDHLISCARCAAIADALHAVERQFQAVALVSPRPGFTKRWRSRLARRRRFNAQRQTTTQVASLSAGLLVLLTVVGARLLPWIQLVAPQFVAWFENVSEVLGHLNLVGEILFTIVENTVAGIPLFYRIAVPTSIFALFALWFTSMYRLGILPIRRRL